MLIHRRCFPQVDGDGGLGQWFTRKKKPIYPFEQKWTCNGTKLISYLPIWKSFLPINEYDQKLKGTWCSREYTRSDRSIRPRPNGLYPPSHFSSHEVYSSGDILVELCFSLASFNLNLWLFLVIIVPVYDYPNETDCTINTTLMHNCLDKVDYVEGDILSVTRLWQACQSAVAFIDDWPSSVGTIGLGQI